MARTAGRKPVTAAVIGVGGFGRHHARILAQLNHHSPAGIPRIDRLIVSRTQLAKAVESVALLRERHHPAAADIIPAEVKNAAQLAALLQTHRPALITIAARDALRGDAIHADYARQALQYGRVFCEKPLWPAVGRPEALPAWTPLRHHVGGRFGLDLPMAAVLSGMLTHPALGPSLRRSASMSFLWSGPLGRNTDLVNDLVLHPWSLIPAFDRYRIQQATFATDGADLDLLIERPRGTVFCRIRLRAGARFRGMQWDGTPLAFVNRGVDVDVVALNRPLEAIEPERPQVSGESLLKIVNPLKQGLLALLRGRPIVGMRRSLQSQLFLERLFAALHPEVDVHR